MNPKPIEVLLVEDNQGDVLLTKKTLEEGRVLNHLSVVANGEAAMEFLNKQGEYTSAPRPDLILLDLNLPRKSGREVLAEVKRDDSLRIIPVVILTTSKAEADLLTSYNLGANCYVVKPVGLDDFLSVVRIIQEFWLQIVKLPPANP